MHSASFWAFFLGRGLSGIDPYKYLVKFAYKLNMKTICIKKNSFFIGYVLEQWIKVGRCF